MSSIRGDSPLISYLYYSIQTHYTQGVITLFKTCFSSPKRLIPYLLTKHQLYLQTQMDKRTELNDELRPEYDKTLLKNGIRGKYAERYAAGTNIIKLDPDVVASIPNAEAVNEALSSLLKEKNKDE